MHSSVKNGMPIFFHLCSKGNSLCVVICKKNKTKNKDVVEVIKKCAHKSVSTFIPHNESVQPAMKKKRWAIGRTQHGNQSNDCHHSKKIAERYLTLAIFSLFLFIYIIF